MNKNYFLLKVCPWCKKTPRMDMPLLKHTGGTWLWQIGCYNLSCKIKPRTRHIGIRNTCKKDKDRMIDKMHTLALEWNSELETPIVEYKIINFQNIDELKP